MKNFVKILTVVLVIAMSVAMFAACVPSDPAKAEANLKEAGYTVLVTSSSALGDIIGNIGNSIAGDLVPKNVDKTVTANKGDDSVAIVYFKDKDSAKTYYDALKAEKTKYSDEIKKEYDEGKITKAKYDELKADAANSKLGKSGVVVWMGTKAGVKAAG
jgi:hypothetical protein